MKSFLQSKSNESSKRLIAFIFSITLVVVYFFTSEPEIRKILIYCYTVLIALLLGLATAETIVSIFKKENKSE
jgi:Mn2+/Fe2+ NRAMP family transporter